MTAQILSFHRVAVRAIVIAPAGDVGEDRCRAVPGGWPIDPSVSNLRGPLDLVSRKLREHPLSCGLPIVVHPECYRRAGALKAGAA